MACSMRRKGHPSFPSAMTCCFFSSLKTLLMPKEPISAPLGVNVPGLPMAGFQLTLHGRIWVTPEDCGSGAGHYPRTDPARFGAPFRPWCAVRFWRLHSLAKSPSMIGFHRSRRTYLNLPGVRALVSNVCGSLRTNSETSFPVMGPSVSPNIPCPVATIRFLNCFNRPTTEANRRVCKVAGQPTSQ